MRKKRQPPQKIKPVNQRKVSKNTFVDPPVEPFHIMLPLTLRHQDGKEEKVCYFQCQEHLDKYIERYKLKPKTYTVTKTQPKAKNILDLLDEI